MSAILRLCLDLNIWCGELIAEQRGRRDTAVQQLVEIARSGQSALGPVQLIISWGMINRLRKVYVQDFQIPGTVADALLSAIAGYAALGPAGMNPMLTLGGTGVVPLTDTEDAHVLETCIAGQAHILVTANFKDFLARDVQVLEANRIALYPSPKGQLLISHPYVMSEWFRQGRIMLPGDEQFDFN
jgi:PIN domain